VFVYATWTSLYPDRSDLDDEDYCEIKIDNTTGEKYYNSSSTY